MAKHNRFDVIGKFFGESQEPLSVSAYEKYKAKYGAERAEGYLQAIRDMSETLGDITSAYDGAQKKASNTQKLYVHSFQFLNSLENK